jgi:predicted O-methyltransferase YrrM
MGMTEVDEEALRRTLDEKRCFDAAIAAARIRALPLPRMFPGIERQSVEIGAIDTETKHANHVDMLYVCAIARHIRARRIFEFGTYLGRTTYHLALGPDVEQVFTLDLDPVSQYPAGLKIGRAVRAVHERGLQGHFFNHVDVRDRITQLHGDSRVFDLSRYVGRIDFVFVDGGHTYELVANDTEHAFRLLAPGGVIVWHDFAPKGRDVVRFGCELSQRQPLFWVSDTSLLVYVDGINPMTFTAPVPAYDRSVLKPE